MTDVDEHGRPESPLAADETATLLGFLEYQRATLAWKCAGLDSAGLRATVAASSMTLGGLLKHLAYVESDWFSRWLHGLARRTWPDGRAPSLRWIMVHMIEEYARHNGHADLLRESVDGRTGE